MIQGPYVVEISEIVDTLGSASTNTKPPIYFLQSLRPYATNHQKSNIPD